MSALLLEHRLPPKENECLSPQKFLLLKQFFIFKTGKMLIIINLKKGKSMYFCWQLTWSWETRKNPSIVGSADRQTQGPDQHFHHYLVLNGNPLSKCSYIFVTDFPHSRACGSTLICQPRAFWSFGSDCMIGTYKGLLVAS